MKNILYIFIGLLIFVSCEESEPKTYDPQNGQTGIKFDSTNEQIQFTEADQEISTDIQVTVSTISNEIRTFNLIVDNDFPTNSLAESNYTISQVTIPANEYFGSFNVTINNDGLTAGTQYELKIDLDTPEDVAILETNKDTVLFSVSTL